MDGRPRVSVVLLTYNHEQFIDQAIASVVAQRTSFPFEVLLTEDCSTDRTRELVIAAAERHPEVIRLFLSERNLNTNEVTLRALRAARGDYVAFLDGDDYWTSPEKLQRQVDYLDAHPGCVISFHDVMQISDVPGVETQRHNGAEFRRISTVEHLLERCFIAGCAPLIRRDVLRDLPSWFEHAPVGDWPIYTLAARRGTVDFLPEPMGVYRIHNGGLWTSMARVRKLESIVWFYETMLRELGPEHGALIRAVLGTRYSDLMLAQEAAGDHAGAAVSLARSLRVAPVGRGIPAGRRMRRVARLLGRVALGRGVTPSQLAAAVRAGARWGRSGAPAAPP
jgi:glycosyltransferase involved in cell wall biosynthesis